MRVVEDFPDDVVNNRKLLLPIFWAAKNSKEKYDEKIFQDILYINGHKYTVDNLRELPVQLLPENVATVTKGNITGFYTVQSPLSNYHPCEYKLNNNNFTTSEQGYYTDKALHFGDKKTADAILVAKTPGKAKYLGKNIKNYVKEEWNKVKDSYMMANVKAKFQQNENLKAFLLNTGNTILAEASGDKFWATGYRLRDWQLWDQNLWVGKNALGVMLQNVREQLG